MTFGELQRDYSSWIMRQRNPELSGLAMMQKENLFPEISVRREGGKVTLEIPEAFAEVVGHAIQGYVSQTTCLGDDAKCRLYFVQAGMLLAYADFQLDLIESRRKVEA